jgi:hypothetical protein
VGRYPTLAELAELPPPPELGTKQNGVSLRQAFVNPHDNGTTTKPFAFSQYPRCGAGPLLDANGDCLQVAASNFSTMGYSVRDTSYRYTQWKVRATQIYPCRPRLFAFSLFTPGVGRQRAQASVGRDGRR